MEHTRTGLTTDDVVEKVKVMMPMNSWPDAACDIVGAVKEERRRTIEIILLYRAKCANAPSVVRMLDKMLEEVRRD